MSKQKFQNKYRIPSARACWHDYNGGLYFITICTTGMEHYFGKIMDGEMCLNTLGAFVEENILNLTNHYPYAEITSHQVMPNHLHLIVAVNGLHELNRTHVETGRAPSLQDATEKQDAMEIQDATEKQDAMKNQEPLECQESTVDNPKPENEYQPEQNIKPVDEKMQLISQRKGLLSIAMGGLKSATTKFANNNKITFGWQERFHDHIIRNQDEYNRIVVYIENNPATWKQDKFYTVTDKIE